MQKNGANQTRGQEKNRGLVLSTLQHLKLCSRAELAKQTALKQATITYIINDFIKWGLVEETGLLAGEKGRRSIGVRFSEKKYRVIGFRLTRQYYTIGVFSLDGTEDSQRVFKPIEDTNPTLILETVCETINQMIDSQPDKTFLAVGVAVPGPYYADTGEIAVISSFPGWKNIKIREIMQEKISIPTIIEHDANAGALAESYLAADRSVYDTMVYISAGQGIGAGVLNTGAIYSGSLGVAGEIGHTCIDMNGPQCDCGGRGCLTLYASTIALVEKVRSAKADQTLSFQDVVSLINKNDTDAAGVFREVMRYLSIGIVNIIYSYNPRLIVIGDEMSRIGPQVLDEIRSNIKKMNATRLSDQIDIQLARMEDDSAYLGSAVIASHYVFKNVARFFDD